jgi:hypothetical protein
MSCGCLFDCCGDGGDRYLSACASGIGVGAEWVSGFRAHLFANSPQAPRSEDRTAGLVTRAVEAPGAASVGLVRFTAPEEQVNGLGFFTASGWFAVPVGEGDILHADVVFGLGRCASVFASAQAEEEGEDHAAPNRVVSLVSVPNGGSVE